MRREAFCLNEVGDDAEEDAGTEEEAEAFEFGVGIGERKDEGDCGDGGMRGGEEVGKEELEAYVAEAGVEWD